jgi:DNA-binding XRE family transcriptional regulator
MTTKRKEQLIAKRKDSGFTQEEVAKAVGISYRNYKYIEAGTRKTNVETAISIAKLLGCEVTDIFGTRDDFSTTGSDGKSKVA